MIFEETFSIIASIVFITAFVIFLFTLKFHYFKKRFFKTFYEIPSVIMTGPHLSGKKSLISNITKDEIVSHPFEDNLKLGYLTLEDKKMQFISFPYNHAFDFINSEDFEKINKKLLINVFDVSPTSDDIENQIKNFKKISPKFGKVNKVIVANKIDIADNKKLNKLKQKFPKMHKTSSVTNDGLNKLREHIVSS